ncbi:MAG: histidine phosphatase family protein [Anaerolineae bacterium]|nr:histidine phosphatase family protein [Thermoflexales bacterium]MDW8406420.1 histidine phosphatase family protein [Anaerolineae bacterium]
MLVTDLYLVRHGHPLLNTGIAYDRPPGPPLSEVGRAEARLAGMYLASRGVQRLYTSPLDRAQATAALIGAETGLPAVVVEALAEHRREETFDDVQARMRAFLAHLEQETVSAIVLVSHGSPIKAMLLALSEGRLDLSRHIYPNGNHLPTAGIWHARRSAIEGATSGTGWTLDLVFKPVVAAPPAHVPV